MNFANQVMNYNMGSQPQMHGVIAGSGGPAMIPYEQVGYYLPYQQQMIQWVAIPQPPCPQMQCVEFIHPQMYSNEQIIQTQQQQKLCLQYLDGQGPWLNAPKSKSPKNTKHQNVNNVNNTSNNQKPQQQPPQHSDHAFQREFSPSLFGADKAPPQCFDIIGRGNLPSINFSMVYTAK